MVGKHESYTSKAVMKAMSNQSKDHLAEKLKNLMHGNYEKENLRMMVEEEDVAVAPFDPGSCPRRQTISKWKGNYTWEEKVPDAVEAQLSCERNREKFAKRACVVNLATGKASWRTPNLLSCLPLGVLPNNIMGLKNVTITEENAGDVADHILNLMLINSTTLSQEEIKVLVSKLRDIANLEEIGETLATKTLRIINVFMTKEANNQDLQAEVNSMLQIMEQVGFKMAFSGRQVSIILPTLALALTCPDPMSFQGISFVVTSYDREMDPTIAIHQTSTAEKALASLFLPGLLGKYLRVQSFDPEDHTKIQFNFFGMTSLFEDSSFKDHRLNSYVVGASIQNVSVGNLENPVNINLQHIKQNVDGAPVCVFWDFNKNNGLGGWNTSGCDMKYTDRNHTVCNCNHLTHFGVLMDLSRKPVGNATESQALTLVSHVGCGVSSIFLGLTIVIYLSIEKLHGDYPSQILINLCFALLMLNLTFLVNSWLYSFHINGLCIGVAAVLHYFLLATFTWMGLEAIHMYYALIKVFNIYVPNYMVKFSVVGWGIPAVIVVTILIVKVNFYGDGSPSNSFMLFCWIEDNLVFYISVVAYFCLMFLMNSTIFIAVLLQIRTMKGKHRGRSNCESWHRDLKRVASLTFLLGLTWGFAFFAWGPVEEFFMYPFAICNTLQGFFIFIFHCLMKENVRKQCQVHFCCGRLRRSHSDWSFSAVTVGHHPSRNLERNRSCLSLKSQKSCATSSTSNGSGSLPGARPNMNVETDQVSCNSGCTPLNYQKTKLPCVRRISPMDVEPHCTQKTKFLP
ncbi:adhesion G-protein coupled receptor G4 isoform X2 [Hemicordylus capensis]|nr:adhesion G-protein coupled receptor G4 isoform X2 [Hemicordylus capensis]